MSNNRNMKEKSSENCFDSPMKSSTSSTIHLTPVSSLSKVMSGTKINTPRGKQPSEVLGQIDDNVIVTSASSPSLKLAPQNYQLKQVLPQDNLENSSQRRKKFEKSSKGCGSTTLKPSHGFLIRNQQDERRQPNDENLPLSQPTAQYRVATNKLHQQQQQRRSKTATTANVANPARKRQHDVTINDENDAEVAATLYDCNRPRRAKYPKHSPPYAERCASCPEKKKKIIIPNTFCTIEQEKEYEGDNEDGVLYEEQFFLAKDSPDAMDLSSSSSATLRSISTDPLCQSRELLDAQPISQPDPSTYSPSDGFAIKTKRGLSLPSKPEDLCIDEEPTSPARDVFPSLKQEWDQKQLRETLVRAHHSIGDYSRTGQLETVTGAKAGVIYIDNTTLVKLLTGELRIEGRLEIVDCRFPYEYEAGHIVGALNIWKEEQMLERYFTRNAAWTKGPTVVVFYCEFSSERAPKMFSKVRTVDRERNQYPHLHYPEMYVIKGGYKGFFNMENRAPETCEPNSYVEMVDERYGEELVKYKKEVGFCRKDGARSKRSVRKAVFGPRLQD